MYVEIVIIMCLLGLLFFVFYKSRKKKYVLPDNYKELLIGHVSFYRKLSAANRLLFEKKITAFLNEITIEGVGTPVENIDRILVASSAIIPVFYYSNYRYYNLSAVLLYPDNFNSNEFLTIGYEKNTMGMVGTGAMQRTMILSKPALYAGYQNEDGMHNTGIHEFVHLLDKEDGGIDGLPESLLQRKYNSEWLAMVNKSTTEILNGESDINSYAITNKAEFFSVVSEYFFNSPERFERNHKELYELLLKIYRVPKS